MLVLNQSIIYEEIEGYVAYIDIQNEYIIMEIPAAEGRNSPRLIITKENYSRVQTDK